MPKIKKNNKSNVKSEWKPGQFVWARPTNSAKRWWPGVIINHTDGGFKKPKASNAWVFWFGDDRASEVSCKNICSFSKKFMEFFPADRSNLPKIWKQGLLEALQEYGYSLAPKWNSEQLLDWALNGFFKLHSKAKYEFIGIPDSVKNKLFNIRIENIKSQSKCERSEFIREEKDISEAIKNGEKIFKEICIGCFSSSIADDHPIFDAFVCNNCKERIKSTSLIKGEDEIYYYCQICATLGDMLVCDIKECGRSYCKKCIQIFCKPSAEAYIKRLKTWRCFTCNPNDIKIVSEILKIRHDWDQRIFSMFIGTQSKITPIPQITKKRKKMRVLSLFDGIGAGLVALDSLKLPVEKYYSVEIDADAIAVLLKNFGNKVTHLGDIKELNEDVLRKLGPIDLLIGGSPCNDLSFVNPNRKGLYDPNGTGILFFDFYRILTLLKTINGAPFFWLYENVAAMEQENKGIISRFLDCKPRLCDSIRLSAHKRTRLFWGNLPSLCQNDLPDEGPSLQRYLMPGRTATLKKVKSVTTSTNSLEKAVLNMDNSLDVLTIIEIENMFGFPLHFTDTGDMSLPRRQKLIGRSWSVHVVKNLFKCLCDFFVTKTDD